MKDEVKHDYPLNKEVFITSSPSVKSNHADISMKKSDHEKADSRICLHVHNTLKEGATTVLVRTVDSDVAVILVGIFHDLVQHYPGMQCWIDLGTGKHFRYYHVNSLCQELGEKKARALQFFHAFSSSDATSQLSGKVKQTTCKTWKSYTTATEGFTCWNAFLPLEFTSAAFKMIERFTCTMYDTTTSHVTVNDLRQEMFPTKVKMMEQRPPTQIALIQQVNPCLYQASIWRESLKFIVAAPSPEGSGWTRAGTGWRPIWTPLPAAPVGCRELINCSCKAAPTCSKKCKCRNAGLICTIQCLCRGHCEA